MTLRGVVWSGLEYRCPHGITQQAVADMKRLWNINVLRITFNERDYTDDMLIWDGSKNVSYRQILRDITKWCNDLGITVILTLNWLFSHSDDNKAVCSDSTTCCQWRNFSVNQGLPYYPCDFTYSGKTYRAKDMWATMAQEPTYKNDPLVWFDIWGECQAPTTTENFNTWKIMANDIVTNIRNTGANNMCLVDGLNYATNINVWRGNYLTQSNVGYDCHMYAFNDGACNLDNAIGQVLKDGQVVFLCETGYSPLQNNGNMWCNSNTQKYWYSTYMLSWFDGTGRGTGMPTTPIGWTAWSMTDDPLLLAGGSPDCYSYNTMLTPSDYGLVIQNELKQNIIICPDPQVNVTISAVNL